MKDTDLLDSDICLLSFSNFLGMSINILKHNHDTSGRERKSCWPLKVKLRRERNKLVVSTLNFLYCEHDRFSMAGDVIPIGSPALSSSDLRFCFSTRRSSRLLHSPPPSSLPPHSSPPPPWTTLMSSRSMPVLRLTVNNRVFLWRRLFHRQSCQGGEQVLLLLYTANTAKLQLPWLTHTNALENAQL